MAPKNLNTEWNYKVGNNQEVSLKYREVKKWGIVSEICLKQIIRHFRVALARYRVSD